MRRSVQPIAWVVRVLVVVIGTCGMAVHPAAAQDALVERPDPPALDDMETDANKDGLPDGWYNGRDAVLIAKDGAAGPRFLRFENNKPGRPARLSRAYGIDRAKDRSDRPGPVDPAESDPARRARGFRPLPDVRLPRQRIGACSAT